MDLTGPEKELAAKIATLTHSLLLWSFSLPKLAIAALLSRVFCLGALKKTVLYVLAISLLVMSCIVSVFHWTQCRPISHQWKPNIPGSCWPPYVLCKISLANSCKSYGEKQSITAVVDGHRNQLTRLFSTSSSLYFQPSSFHAYTWIERRRWRYACC